MRVGRMGVELTGMPRPSIGDCGTIEGRGWRRWGGVLDTD